MSDRTRKPCQITISRTVKLADSSIIESMHYDVTTQKLQITFYNEEIYEYSDVPENVVKEMMKSKSVGSYFREFIRENYETEKVT